LRSERASLNESKHGRILEIPGPSLLCVVYIQLQPIHRPPQLTQLSPTALSPLVVADPAPIPSLELVERQTNNTAANASAATWIYQGGPGGGRGDRDGDGQGPPPGRGPPEGVDVGRGGGPFGNVTFSITVNPDNDDMWFRIAAPAMYSWIGFAAGTEMASTKAFIMAWEGDREDCMCSIIP
jgi:hypothetical protein